MTTSFSTKSFRPWYVLYMRRVRKQHEQQELCLVRDRRGGRRGGKRPGAGRPPKGPRSSEPHKTRPVHKARHPVHVTIRVVGGLGTLRRRELQLAIREATIVVAKREDFRVVHLSVQANHLHLLVEAQSREALARGMQAFQISAARQINRSLVDASGKRRSGQVFADRYHARPLTSPRAVRNCLAYVLNNWRRHQEDRAEFAKSWLVDPYSTGVDFAGWKELEESATLYKSRPTYQGFIVWRARTWLLAEGWKQYAPISVFDVPGPLAKPLR